MSPESPPVPPPSAEQLAIWHWSALRGFMLKTSLFLRQFVLKIEPKEVTVRPGSSVNDYAAAAMRFCQASVRAIDGELTEEDRKHLYLTPPELRRSLGVRSNAQGRAVLLAAYASLGHFTATEMPAARAQSDVDQACYLLECVKAYADSKYYELKPEAVLEQAEEGHDG